MRHSVKVLRGLEIIYSPHSTLGRLDVFVRRLFSWSVQEAAVPRPVSVNEPGGVFLHGDGVGAGQVQLDLGPDSIDS